MTDNWDDGNNDGGPKALRDHVKKLEEQLAAEKTRAEQAEAKARKSTISDVLREKGFDPRAATFVPATVEATEDKLTAWLEENKDLLPKVAPVNEPPKTDAPPAGSGDDDDDDDRMSRASQMSVPADKIRDLESRIDNAKSAEDLDKVLAEARGIRFK